MAAIGTLGNLAQSAADVGRLLGPQGVSRVYRTTRAVKDLSQELSGANRNVWGLARGFRAIGESAGLLSSVADKIRSLRESTRQWLDDLFVVSAGALAAQYEEALWDIRAEAMDTFNQLRHQTLLIQTRLLVDDEQVRQAVQPLAAINVPIEQVRAWAEWSLKVSAATGASAQELSAMAADMITFGVRAKAAYRAMDKLVGAAQAGYMTMAETVEVLKDAVDLMGQLGSFGDQAFQNFAEGLALARAALNTMGIPNWQEAFNQFKQSIMDIQDITNEQGQKMAAIIAHFTGRSLEEVRNLAATSTSEYFKLFTQATFAATQQVIQNFGGLAKVVEEPWRKVQVAKIVSEQFGLPFGMAMRLIGDAEQKLRDLQKQSVDTFTAEREALREAWRMQINTLQATEERMRQQGQFAKLWADFKSQISELTTAFKELGHTFMVSFGTPLLWIGKTVLKIFVVPLKELITLFIELNQRTHGLITYLTTLTIAWITFRKLLMASDLLAWAKRMATAEQVMAKTATATTALTTRLDALRQRSRLFDALASGAGRAARAIKRRLIPAATAATTAVAETGTAALASATLQQKAAKRAAAAIRWVATVAEETALLQQRVVSGIVSSVTTMLPRLLAVLTNPYVLIGTAFVVSMNYWAKHKQEILAWLENFPKLVHQFITQSLVKTAHDFVGLIPDLVGALTQAIIVAFRELPSVIIQLIPALAKAFFLGGVEAAKALVEGFKENFWGALATTLAIGWFVKAFIAPKLMAALLRFLPGPVTRALTTVFTGAGTKAAGALGRLPLFEPLLAGARHLFDAFETVKRRVLRSWSSVDWSKLWKAGKINLIADKFVQVMKVGFDEVLNQGKLLWSALRAQLVKSKIGEAFVGTVESGFRKARDLLTRRRRRGRAAAPSLTLDVDTKTLKKGLDRAKALVGRYAGKLAQPLGRLGGVVARSLSAALPAISSFASQALAMLAPLLTNPYVLAGAAVVAGIALLWKYRKKLWEWAKSIGAWLKGFFGKVVGWVVDLAKKAFYLTPIGLLTKLVQRFFPDLWAKIVAGFRAVVDKVKAFFSRLPGWVLGLAKKAFYLTPIGLLTKLVQRFFPAVWEKITAGFRAVADKVKAFLSAPFRALRGLITRARDWLARPLALVRGVFERIAGWVRGPVEAVQNFFGRFADVAAWAGEKIKAALGPVVAIIDKIRGAWNWVKKIFGGGKEKEKPAPKPEKLTATEAVRYAKTVPTVVGEAPAPRTAVIAGRAVPAAQAAALLRPVYAATAATAATVAGRPVPAAQAAQLLRPFYARPLGPTPVAPAAPLGVPARRGAPAARPVPTPILRAEPAELSALTTIATNTDVMVELLRKIETNTRKGAAPRPAPRPAAFPPPRAVPTAAQEQDTVFKLVTEGHL